MEEAARGGIPTAPLGMRVRTRRFEKWGSCESGAPGSAKYLTARIRFRPAPL